MINHNRKENEEEYTHTQHICGASQMALMVKNLPANVGDIRDPGWEPELEDKMMEMTTKEQNKVKE